MPEDEDIEDIEAWAPLKKAALPAVPLSWEFKFSEFSTNVYFPSCGVKLELPLPFGLI